MKHILFISLLISTLNNFAHATSVKNSFLGAELAAQYQCSDKLNDYNFEREYEKLFPNSYSNRDVSKIKLIAMNVNKALQDSCKKNKYLAGGWNVQSCYEACASNFPKSKEENMREQCQATCSSLEKSIDSLVGDVGSLIDRKIVHTKNCETEGARVNNSTRGKVKEPQWEDMIRPETGTRSGRSK